MNKMGGFLSEFKAFALRGSVFDMTVGVVLGTAFTAIVNALVQHIIMPIVSYATGGMDFKNWAIPPGSADTGGIAYGMFIQAVVTFIIIAFVVFLLVKFMSAAFNSAKFADLAKKGVEADVEKTTEQTEIVRQTEAELLAEIRDLLKAQTK